MKKQKFMKRARILTSESDPGFAQQVADHLGVRLDIASVTRFANTEIKAEVPAVRGKHVFAVQSHEAPVNESLMEHVALINAARRASAREVTAVVPYRAYSRADRPDNSHESYMGPLAMRMLAMAGADRIVEIDPHAGQSAGFLPDFSVEYTTVPAHPAIYQYLEDGILDLENLDRFVMTSPDSGRAKTLRKYADHYTGTGFAIVDKQRTGKNQVESNRVVGKVKDRHCIMIDDMIDTAGTIVKGAETLREKGASEVTVIATHGILSDPAIERLVRAKAQGIIARIAVTDTLKLPAGTPEGLIDTISIVPLLSATIRSIFNDESVSGMKLFR